jgi:membrane protein
MQGQEELFETPGAAARSPWQLPLAAWIQIFKRVWAMIGFHNLWLLSGGVAFFTFLAITPLLASTVMIYGMIGDGAMVERQIASLTDIIPGDVAAVLERQLVAAVNTNAGAKGVALAVTLFFSLYGATRAAGGMISALNIINEEIETRNLLQFTLRAVSLTLAAIGIAVTGLSSASVFALLQTASSDLLGPVATPVVKLLTWIAALLLASFGFAMIMRFGPDRAPAKWRWLTPGSVLATVLFLAISFGFSLYVAYISDYNATYGSLSAIVVFLMWLVLSAFGVLLGALVNAEAERQTFTDSTEGAERPLGERGAVLADSTVLDGYMEQYREKTRLLEAERIARRLAMKEAMKKRMHLPHERD